MIDVLARAVKVAVALRLVVWWVAVTMVVRSGVKVSGVETVATIVVWTVVAMLLVLVMVGVKLVCLALCRCR
jgi:hypothetical protein